MTWLPPESELHTTRIWNPNPNPITKDLFLVTWLPSESVIYIPLESGIRIRI